MPLAVAAGALVLVGIGAALLGSTTGQDAAIGGGAPETTTTSTISPLAIDASSTTAFPTTTVPPTLIDLLPGAESGLTVVFRDGRFGTVAQWEPTQTMPSFVPLTARPDIASFDASAEWLAYLSFFRTDAALHLGRPATSQPAQFIGVSGAVWHPGDPRRIAWTAQLPTAETASLFEGFIDPETRILTVSRRLTDVAPNEAVVAWGEWGFLLEQRFLEPAYTVNVTSSDDAAGSRLVELRIVTALDSEGQQIAAAPASFLDATDDGLLLLTSTIAALEPLLSDEDTLASLGIDGTAMASVPDGVFLADPALNLVDFRTNGPLLPERTHFLTHDGERVIEVARGSGTTVTTYSLAGRGTRIVSLGQPSEAVGLTSDGQYLVVQDAGGSGDLVFVDWQFGRIIPVPIGAGVAVAVDLR